MKATPKLRKALMKPWEACVNASFIDYEGLAKIFLKQYKKPSKEKS